MDANFQPNSQQMGLLWHSLGLSPQNRKSFRNGFVASTGHHNYDDLKILENAGLMKLAKTPGFMASDSLVFVVTEHGQQLAMDSLPAPAEPTKYEDYLRSDYGHSFSEFLGITLPEIEYRNILGKTEYRFTRRKMDRLTYEMKTISGEWAFTKKQAKASYKSALKQSSSVTISVMD